MSPTEKTILERLSRGVSYAEIARRMGITINTLHSHCYQIRKKTGIRDTKDAVECRIYLHGHETESTIAELKRIAYGPTQGQLRCMLMLAQGDDVHTIAQRLGVAISTVRNHLASGLNAAQIKRHQLSQYLTEKGLLKKPSPMDDPAFL